MGGRKPSLICAPQAWAAKDALQNVMEVECRTLVQRLQDLESDLSNGRAERDQFAEVTEISCYRFVCTICVTGCRSHYAIPI